MADDNSWKTPNFRQSVVNKINEVIQQTGMISTKNGIEMENHVFNKARNKDEYFGFVTRLILHVREMNSKHKNQQNAAAASAQQEGGNASQQSDEGGGDGGTANLSDIVEDNSWKTPNFRQSVVNKFNEAIQQTGMTSSKNGIEMENHVFHKARNKDEYLGFAARLILHVRGMNNEHRIQQNYGTPEREE